MKGIFHFVTHKRCSESLRVQVQLWTGFPAQILLKKSFRKACEMLMLLEKKWDPLLCVLK